MSILKQTGNDTGQAPGTKRKVFLSYLFLGLAGIILSYIILRRSVLFSWPYATPLAEEYMSLRRQWLDSFISEVKSTGIYSGLHRLYDQNSVMYLYLSYLGAIIGGDSVGTFHFVQLGFTFLCMSALPAIYYRAFKNFAAALSPMLFFRVFCPYSVYFPNDSYWAGALLLFVGRPALFFLFREKISRQNFVWALLLAFLSGIANVFRSQAGLGVSFLLIALALVKLAWPAYKEKSKIRAAGAAGLVLAVALFYSLFTNYIPRAYQKVTGQPEPLPIKGPWHTLYVGLGWEENPLGIEFLDASGFNGRENLLYNVSDGYYMCVESPRYIRRKKADFLSAVKSHPAFFLSSYIRKTLRCFVSVYQGSVIDPVLLKDPVLYKNSPALILYRVSLALFAVRLAYDFKKEKSRCLKNIFTVCFIGVCLFGAGILPGIIANPYYRQYILTGAAAADCFVMLWTVKSRRFLWDRAKEILSVAGKKSAEEEKEKTPV